VVLLAVEFLIVFWVGPALFTFTRHRIPAIPALWVLLAYCLFVLLRNPRFDRKQLWDTSGFWQTAPAILCLFAPVVVSGVLLVLRFTPGTFLNLLRSNPLVWSLVMILYPLFSVYPQGIVYRVFIFSRYRALFGPGWAIVLASATTFAFVHIVFRSPLTLALAFLGGLLFAIRYLQTGSLLISSFEHALYGCAIFTIGLGRWFYYGAAPRG